MPSWSYARRSPSCAGASFFSNSPALHVTAGELALARQDAPVALYRAAEALALAAPRGMRLVHADALVLRGRARLLKAEIDSAARALDDAEEALRLARDCGYAWAERDALFLEAETRAALSARHDSDNASAATRERDASRRNRAAAGLPRPIVFRGGSAWRRKPLPRTPISVIFYSPQIPMTIGVEPSTIEVELVLSDTA